MGLLGRLIFDSTVLEGEVFDVHEPAEMLLEMETNGLVHFFMLPNGPPAVRNLQLLGNYRLAGLTSFHAVVA